MGLALDLAVLTAFAAKIVKAIVFIVIGKIVLSAAQKWLGKALDKAKLDPMLHKFVLNILKVVVWVEIILAVMDVFGFDASSLLTIFAAAGAAVALALQGSLSNFAGGILITVTRPFSKGDYIVCAGNEGAVDHIDLLSTTLITPDNRVVIVPNGTLINNSITNATKKDTRRVDMEIGIAYDTDVEYAKKVLIDFISSDARVLKDPAVFVEVMNYGDSAVELVIRAWCSTADYWGVKFDIQTAMKGVLTQAGIQIPYPQVDVHIENK